VKDRIDRGLKVARVQKNFDGHIALNGVDLEVGKGEFFALLGPSGCGKTTLLRIIAGLELPDSGRVFLGDQDVTHLPAAKRNVNTVFQSYALFPHLNIFENVAFGLKARNVEPPEVKRKVGASLEMLSLTGLEKRFPSQLSGGQKQRVALARALVNEPDILLLDEPMSALDAHLRSQVQQELRHLQKKLKTTFILVTHDQDEAMMISDRLAVMNDGQVIQTGSPREVYSQPMNQFVAEFLGAANILPGRCEGDCVVTEYGQFRIARRPSWQEGHLAIRPEHICLDSEGGNLGENRVHAQVREAIYRGQSLDLWLDPGPLRVRTDARDRLVPGDHVSLFFPPEDLVALNSHSL
jgi:spermidine/putrescine transport system ATP-binding protein